MREHEGAGGEIVEVDLVFDNFQAGIVQEMVTGWPLCSTGFALGEMEGHTVPFVKGVNETLFATVSQNKTIMSIVYMGMPFITVLKSGSSGPGQSH
jgi:hypothetical protein